jgi:transposase
VQQLLIDSTLVRAHDIAAVIPCAPIARNHSPTTPPHTKERHLVECVFNKIKHDRRLASRDEKTAANAMAFLHLTSFLI